MLLSITQQAKYWWPGLRKDIGSYLKNCNGCQRLQKGRKKAFNAGKIQTFSKTKPFELVSIDICGPLPQTSNGNRYIVSIIDKFTRFCLLVPVPNIKTMTIIKAYQRWLNLFGAPANLLSDNGTQFTAEIFKTFNEIHDTHQRFATPYYPECNGQVERLHRWIKERLSLISIDTGMNFIDGDDDWDDYIGTIQHAYNSTPNAMTKCSPNKIIFGSDFKMNVDSTNITYKSVNKSTKEFIKYMNNNRSIIQNKAINNQKNYDKIRSKSYNKKRLDTHEYDIGDLVLIDISRRLIGNESKFNASWHGPHEIIDIIEPNKTFKIREINDIRNIQQINIRLMKPYKMSPCINLFNYMKDYPNLKAEEKSNKIIKYIQCKIVV